MRGFEALKGGGGVGDNMHGWASVGHGMDICLSYNTAHSKKEKKNRQTKYRKTNREGRVTKDYKVSCLKFIVPVVLKTN